MGIEHFYNWIKVNYPKSILKPEFKNRYDYILIDTNHILHHCATGSDNIQDLKYNLFKQFDIIFSNFIATKYIIIATDGTAPYAKVLLQRIRRQKVLVKDDEFSSAHLTPGTKTMSKVDDFLHEYAEKLKQTYKKIKPNIIILDSKIPGEGELKLFNQLGKLLEKSKKNNSTLIIGNDADLIVMASSFVRIAANDFYVLIHHMGRRDLFSLGQFILGLKQNYKNYKYDENKLRLDFALMALLQGNDYLPRLSYIDLDITINTYFNADSTYFNIDPINSIDPINPINPINPIDSTLNLITIYDSNYAYLNMNNFSNFLLDILLQLSKKNKGFKSFKLDKYVEIEPYILKYVEGLLWCLNMYMNGECPKLDYIYDYRSIPPVYLMMFLIKFKNTIIKPPISDTPPLSISYYTLLIMPYSAKALVDKRYHKLMDNELGWLYEIEKCKECMRLKEELSRLTKLRSNEDENTEDLKKEISKISSTYSSHSKTHEIKFDIHKVMKIVKDYERL